MGRIRRGIELRRLTVAAALVALVAGLLIGTGSLPTVHPRLALSVGNGFTVTGAIDAAPGCSTPALLFPGTPRCIVYTVHNPLHVAITVSSLSLTLDPGQPPPSSCPASNLDLSHTSFAGSLTVQASRTASVSEPISLMDSGASQDGCQNVSFHFTYSGAASYEEVFATSTSLGSSLNPSNIGQPVTYTATVTPAVGADPLPNQPTGSVTFKDGSTVLCSAVAVTPGAGTTSVASCPVGGYIANGSHTITAAFANSDGNFAASTSPALTQSVTANPPAACSSGAYQDTIVATPSKTKVSGTSHSDLIFAFGADYWVDGQNGNDCIDAGDGSNTITDGNGNDVVLTGSGADTVTVGNGNDSVTLGGSSGSVTLGNGIDTVTLQGGSHNTIVGGNYNETIYLGTGTFNTYKGGAGANICHVSAPLSASHDTVTNCTVVSP